MGKAVGDMDLDEMHVVMVFEGQGVIETAIEVRNLSGGLNEAHETEPKVGQIGDTGSIVFDYEIVEVDHKPVKPKAWREGDEGMLRRVHVLRARTVTYVDSGLVKDAIDAQQKKNIALSAAKARSEEKRAGVQRLTDQPRATRSRASAPTKKTAATVTNIGASKK